MINYFKEHKLFSVFLIFINIIPLLGVASSRWEVNNIIYFYWAECAAFGLLFFLPHLRRFVVFAIIYLFIVGLIYPVLQQMPLGDIRIILTFLCIYALAWIGYIELTKTRFWLYMRRLSPVEQFIYYLAFMATAIIVSFVLTITVYGAWDVMYAVPKSILFLLVLVSMIVPSIALGILRIIDMAGASHVMNFFLGTYQQPTVKPMIVVFLDMAGSTSIAEKIGPKKSMSLIATFIYDASDIFRKNGGDIINYTGDGIVTIWPIKHSDKVLTATERLRQRYVSKRGQYKREFGVIPNFRIGVHAGPIVMSQIGEEKLFLGIYGDVVNTAARLEQLNKELNTQVLFSQEALKYIPPNRYNELDKQGAHSVKGKEEKIEVFSLRELV